MQPGNDADTPRSKIRSVSEVVQYRLDPCPDCGGKVEVRSNRSRYCKVCYYQRYGRSRCPRCAGKMRTTSTMCAACHEREVPAPRQMSEAEVAWVAGIVEGEGSFDKTRARLAVAMTDRDIIERLHRVTGIGNVYFDRPGARAHHKPSSCWYVSRREHVGHIVGLMYPWLGQRRQESVRALAKRAGFALPAGLEPAA